MNAHEYASRLPAFLVPFVTLSYPTAPPSNPDSFPTASYYGTGRLDICFVVMWIGLLGILREISRLKLFAPFARRFFTAVEREKLRPNGTSNGAANGPVSANGHGHGSAPLAKPKPKRTSPLKDTTRKMTKQEWMRERSVVRFAEQGWPFLYYTVYWVFGLYIHVSLPTSPWRLENMWRDYPHVPLAGPIKFYYLTQLAGWLHQILIINAEAWRKDHLQMMTHHVVTIALVSASYAGNYTRVGCLIMVLMDWCDIWLALAKMARYLSLSTLCDTFFGVFIVSWLFTRQIAFLLVIVSAYYGGQTIEQKWDPAAGHYLTAGIYYGFLSFLAILQVLLCMWFATAVRIVWKVLGGSPVEDLRSDEEMDLTELEDEDVAHTESKKER